ncbi:MAG TPA: 2-oxo-4-hydroxy-4-carboxy-5-ureidoimidazoline decarboxylase [Phycisphaerae bacterium]|nr:2-oxo-4-hydroxy-4-carboxy-5-ureidoimidazoline decarboxylase [Phycisphaerae bacterium]
MPVDVARIRSDIEAIALCTQTPGAGATRPTFSDSWGASIRYIRDQAVKAGAVVRSDAAGNLHARARSLAPDQSVWLCGSHLDTVPHGGNYDGVVGVVVALELLRNGLALELVVFAEEEGTTFSMGMLGSRAWTGQLGAAQLCALRNDAGQSYLEAGAKYGVEPAKMADDRLRPPAYRGMIEVHIEQGPRMWNRGEPLAVVSAIAGRRQYLVRIRGTANHAGTTSMHDRRDALAGAAEIMVALERIAVGETVLTVGRLINHPNAVNVIPDSVEFTVDFRAASDAALTRGDTEIRRVIEEICHRRKLALEIQLTESMAACPMDAQLCDQLSRLGKLPVTHSGALHDSAVFAGHIPTVMLFVRSRDGISHHPDEFSRVEDIAAAADLVGQMIRRPTLSRLNSMTREEFVGVCGPFFEHSPWIADRAWLQRPFASAGDLYEKLCAVVEAATPEEKLKLIRAHPDLVGRMARENRLSRESASEQAAAGLTSLSADEIAVFERHNAEYTQRFGFPFVVCARQNRKQAILDAFPRRLAHSREEEIASALAEIFKIARLRLADAIGE